MELNIAVWWMVVSLRHSFQDNSLILKIETVEKLQFSKFKF